MRKLLMGSVLFFVAMQGLCWAQTSTPEWQRCWSRGTTVPAEARVKNCTNLIERGERREFSTKLLAVAYSNRGIAYRELDLTDQAISDFNKAISLDAELDVAYYNRGNAYGHKGLYDQAIADYTKSIEIAPDHAAYTNRAWAYEKKGKRDEAIEDYRVAFKLDPSDKAAKDALERLGVSP